MRISDWSSDVCSSDLAMPAAARAPTGGFASKRPAPAERAFTSPAIEAEISRVKAKIADPELAWLFENCYPNTLDTTVQAGTLDGRPDTFVITGDIEAMWLRDSSAQVQPYIPLVRSAEHTSELQSLMRLSYAVFCLKKK